MSKIIDKYKQNLKRLTVVLGIQRRKTLIVLLLILLLCIVIGFSVGGSDKVTIVNLIAPILAAVISGLLVGFWKDDN